MKKIILLGLMLMFGISASFSQSLIGNMTMGATPPEGYTSPKKDSAKVNVKETQRVNFYNLKFIPGKTLCSSANDRDYIKKGESFRIKYVFDTRRVFDLRVETGFAKNPIASPKELRKGEWIVEIKPEKSMMVVVSIENTRKGVFARDKRFILVIDPDKYDEIHAKFEEFRLNKDAKGREEYYRKIAGEEYERYLKQRLVW